jgi:hypothetical protein
VRVYPHCPYGSGNIGQGDILNLQALQLSHPNAGIGRKDYRQRVHAVTALDRDVVVDGRNFAAHQRPMPKWRVTKIKESGSYDIPVIPK